MADSAGLDTCVPVMGKMDPRLNKDLGVPGRSVVHQNKGKARPAQPIDGETVERVSLRVQELMQSTASKLEADQRKAAMAFNIALVEEISRHLAELVRHPKTISELSELLRASGELAIAMQETKAADSAPRSNTLIEGTTVNGWEHSVDPLADALAAFRKGSNTAIMPAGRPLIGRLKPK